MKPVIEVSELGKSYKISHQTDMKAGYRTLKDDFANLLKKPLGFHAKDTKETFWALKDISFSVHQGESFGIIGKNGSGKSTLLKILSRIVEPTKGSVKLEGRVASLLEVGTGFHPELTGRENIFFNGSMLGMGRHEIRKKFAEIVEFSEIEKFLDTPVKFYSSGMYVRLAFAVAAHLDPEILILDEVLAVGDAQFQKKSLAKMLSIAKGGRTIIFVSHSMTAVEEVCERAMLLHNGKIKLIGDTATVADTYLKQGLTKEELSTEEQAIAIPAEPVKLTGPKTPINQRSDREGSGRIKCIELSVKNQIAAKRSLAFDIVLQNKTRRAFHDIKLSFDLFDHTDNYISNLLNYTLKQRIDVEPGKNHLSLIIENFNLVPGSYYINCFIARDFENTEIFDWVQKAAVFKIGPYDFYQTKEFPRVSGKFVYLDYHYETN